MIYNSFNKLEKKVWVHEVLCKTNVVYQNLSYAYRKRIVCADRITAHHYIQLFKLKKLFKLMVVRFICAQYDKRMPRRFKIEKTKDEMLCEKIYCESDITEDLNFHET